jgi:hypothetical protein
MKLFRKTACFSEKRVLDNFYKYMELNKPIRTNLGQSKGSPLQFYNLIGSQKTLSPKKLYVIE